MGYLTTITIYNDGLHDIEENQEQFMKNLLEAIRKDETSEIGCGSFANVAKVQRSRHADNWAIYVHAGNTLTYMSAFSDESEHFNQVNPGFFRGMIDYLVDQSKALKSKFLNKK